MTTGERIKTAREKKGYSQEELANLLGYKSRSSVNKMENGRDIPRSVIVKLSELLDVTPAYLMGWDDVESNAEILPNNKVHMIPVFESVSAGFGAYACSDIVDYIPLFIDNPSDVPDTLCIKVKGDSMYPKIEDRDIIVVRKQSSVDSGQIAVVLIDNEEGLVKKIVYDNEKIELHSINPMYPVQVFEKEEMKRICIVGLVKQVIKNL